MWARKCNDFNCKILDLSQAGKTISQNHKVIRGSIWTGKCDDFNCIMYDLNQAGETISQNQRLILGSIYTATIVHFINNKSFEETKIVLNKHLKRTTYIPKIKNKFDSVRNLSPALFRVSKKFSFFKQ